MPLYDWTVRANKSAKVSKPARTKVPTARGRSDRVVRMVLKTNDFHAWGRVMMVSIDMVTAMLMIVMVMMVLVIITSTVMRRTLGLLLPDALDFPCALRATSSTPSILLLYPSTRLRIACSCCSDDQFRSIVGVGWS